MAAVAASPGSKPASKGAPEGKVSAKPAAPIKARTIRGSIYFGPSAAADATSFGSLEVPLHLRNAPTRLMKEIGYGKGYRHAHDEPGAYAAGARYLPEGLPDRRYYVPAPRGLEIKIGEALDARRARDRAS